MSNPNWYLLCNLENGIAVDFLQIPETWGNITGMADFSDEQLADLSWSGNSTFAFLLPAAAVAEGIDPDSIAAVVATNLPGVKSWIRAMRDYLLIASDVVTTSDRWASYTAVDKKYVKLYRQALRDITLQDPLATVWPAVPPQLDFLRSSVDGNVERPSAEFVAALTQPFPVITIAEARDNRWLLIHDERERRKSGGVKVQVSGIDYWFWSDEPTRNQYALLEGFARRNSLPASTVLDNWKTMSGAFVPFPVSLLHSVIDAGIAQEKVLFNIAETHRQAMLAATDPSQYDYSTGWPQTYAEFAAIP